MARAAEAGPWRLTRAQAKINLGLRVVGRRADGYHLLDSLVAFADIGDHIALRPGRTTKLQVSGPFGPALAGTATADNLVVQAAERFIGRFGGTAVDIRLWKRLPVASGIGGGSADAAAVLRLLAALAGMPEDDPDLAALALTLGADVPMCLGGAPARVGGIGETLGPAPHLPPLPAVLANCGAPVATPAVFQARRGKFSEPAALAKRYDTPAALAVDLRIFGNDLTAAATTVAPGIVCTLEALTPGALFAGMSGSGATCFALHPTAEAARLAAKALRRARPGWWVQPACLNRV